MTAAIALPIVIAYGRRSIDLTYEPHRFQWVLAYLIRGGGLVRTALIGLASHVRMPEAFWDFAEGIAVLKGHNDSGHLSYLLGELRSGGWWYFYLVALAAKTPLDNPCIYM
jgi:hypothetical protein